MGVDPAYATRLPVQRQGCEARRPSEWDANEWNGSGARSSRHRQNWLGANIALMQPDIDLRESEATCDSTSFRA